MRQVRRIETRRDDPLVDAALRTLGQFFSDLNPSVPRPLKESSRMSFQHKITPPGKTDAVPDEATLMAEAARILRRLCEKSAVLAVAADMEKAVIVRDGPGGGCDAHRCRGAQDRRGAGAQGVDNAAGIGPYHALFDHRRRSDVNVRCGSSARGSTERSACARMRR
ncbi:MAG: hypothetical protein HC814_05585 [Rhodobacteraceae bacterium]|nr:hypothetical protein [Paracoccaceae bacterium]